MRPTSAALFLGALAALSLLLTLGAPRSASGAEETGLAAAFREHVDASGAIRLPKDFRAKWTHLGTFVVADKTAPGAGVHDVYAQPEAVAHYRAHRKWPDGAILVKEIRAYETAPLTTGQAAWAGEVAQWFVMMKDAQGRYPGNPLWAEGWGWSLYKGDAPEKQAAKSFAADCLACHVPAKATDWVYVQGYPTLRK